LKKIKGMSLVYAKVTMCNPQELTRSFEDYFLIDTGALFSFAPADKLFAIGVEPSRKETFRQMDGNLIECEIGRVLLKVAGKEEVVPVVFGKPNDDSVIGALALESLALSLDPTTGTLHSVILLAVTDLLEFVNCVPKNKILLIQSP